MFIHFSFKSLLVIITTCTKLFTFSLLTSIVFTFKSYKYWEARWLIKSYAVMIVFIDLLIGVMLFIALFNKLGLPYIFIISSACWGILTVFLLFKHNHQKVFIGHLFFIYIIRCSIFFVSTGFTVLPFGDPYWDVGVVQAFFQSGKAEVINVATIWPSATLKWMSGWPLLHIFTVQFMHLTSLSVIESAIVISFLFMVLFFIFAYLITKSLFKDKHDQNMCLSVALLLFTTSPDSLFWNMQFKYQTIAMLLMFAIYLIVVNAQKNIKSRLQLSIVATVFLFATVIGHHLTAFAVIAYLILLGVIFKIVNQIKPKVALNDKFFTQITIATLVLCFLWTIQYADFVWPSIGSVLEKIIAFFRGVTSFEKAIIVADYPQSLKPQWGIIMLFVRDVIMYIPAILGYFLLMKKENLLENFNFLIVASLSIFGIILVADLLVIHIEPLRIVTYALPFLMAASAFFYGKVVKRNRAIFVSFVLIIVFSGFIGLWSHNYVPIHLWGDFSLSPKVGEHNPQYECINNFLSHNISGYSYIYTDDHSLLYPMLSPSSYKAIRSFRVGDHAFGNDSNAVVISFRDFGIYSYSGAMALASYDEKLDTYEEFIDLKRKVKTKVYGQMLKVLDQGSIALFASKGV